MRIALFSDNFYPEISGISDSIITTGQELMRRGHEVVFVAPKYGAKEYAAIAGKDGLATTDDRADVPTIRLPSIPFSGSATRQSRIVIPYGSSLKKLRSWRPDIIHTHMAFGTGFEALISSWRLNVPLVGTNHTPIEDYVRYAPIHGKWVEMRARRFFSWYYNKCVYMTTPYKTLLQDMRAVGFSGKSQVLPNPIRTDLFKIPTMKERTELRQKWGLTGPTLLYIGRLAPEKKIDVVIKALPKIIASFPDITFAIAGNGATLKELASLAKKLGVEKNVRFVGFLSVNEMAELCKASDIFTIMSTVETQCLGLVQALATGIPAVGARARALPDYLPENAGFLVTPEDSEMLAEKIKVLLADSELRTEMGISGSTFAKQFSPEHIAKEWERIYQEAKNEYQSKS